ncbi:SmdB family multidrug efflux ABC transporter permease/ATP-binding protein [Photobacterium sp. WH77]|uniref:SmdB family multidrug efflux ABC transporter permease/ATP-binding protein n=1 Tax=unclassified Photobacterium TaxID=2628852 RepID=UPI001EDA4DFE|nr:MULTISPECIES: SmdB family multidrug efflux ABC transporter permease/ATP-binding protein [unclassified Photobacterium]MCG2837008.1 SmdB family multidrug efflux ABC transporter permease/ATP-binding protein [Photobacterium sp. WH77]MCG2844383.1 SmdB family multidrug efflux ABC transporter permease/ATP-binding protein [Photobacterium sp. WH80]
MKRQAVNRAVLQRLLRYALDDKRNLFIAIALLFVASLADVSGPWLLQRFIDNYIAVDQFPAADVAALVAAYIALMMLAGAFKYAQSLRFNQIAIGVVQKVRKQLFTRVMNQPLSAFDYMPSGKLISRLTNDTESIKDFYVFVIATFLKNVTLIVVMLTVMFIMSWRLTLVVMALLPVVVGVMVVYQHKSASAYRRMRDLLADINSSMSESIQGMSLIQLMRQEKAFSAYFAGLTDQHLRAQIGVTKLNSVLLRPLIDLLSGIALLTLVALFGFGGTDLIGVGVLYAFLSYLGRVTEPLIEMTQQLSLLQQALVASERIFALIDSRQQAYGEDERALTSGHLACRKLSFSYDGKQKVLDNIDLELPHQGFLALVGHTGSGKSTLASLMMGFYPSSEGGVELDGRPLESLSRPVLRQGIAMVQQDPHVLSDTVRENVSLGREMTDDQIWHALETVGLAGQIKQYEFGLDTVLGGGEVNLSAGQKQLLALARVLVEQPKVLILDEATANIDSGTEQKIQHTLSVLRQNMSIVVIAHRLSTIMDADEIVVLHHGEVIERGTHFSLLSERKQYWQMYQLQQVSDHLQHLEEAPAETAEN